MVLMSSANCPVLSSRIGAMEECVEHPAVTYVYFISDCCLKGGNVKRLQRFVLERCLILLILDIPGSFLVSFPDLKRVETALRLPGDLRCPRFTRLHPASPVTRASMALAALRSLAPRSLASRGFAAMAKPQAFASLEST